MKFKKHLTAITIIVFVFVTLNGIAQSVGDYRSFTNGDWNNTATWETYSGTSWGAASSAPISSEGLITILSGHTITVNSNVSADQIIVNTGGVLTIIGGTLTIDDGTGIDLAVDGTLNLTSVMSVVGTTSINSGGAFIWGGGTLTGAGIITLQSGAIGTLNGIVKSIGNPLTFINNGAITWSSGDLGSVGCNGGYFTNNGTIDITADLRILSNCTVGQALIFTNTLSGIITKSAGSGIAFFGTFQNTTFNNDGVINVNSGEIDVIATGTHTGKFNVPSNSILTFTHASSPNATSNTFASGSSIFGTGNVKFTGSIVTFNAGSHYDSTLITTQTIGSVIWNNTNQTINKYTFSDGIITCNADLTIDSSFIWSIGEINGSGKIYLDSNAAGTFNGLVKSLRDPFTLVNNGVIVWSSGDIASSGCNGGTFTNNGILEIKGDLRFVSNCTTGQALTIKNGVSGSITKTSGNGNAYIGTYANTTLINDGRIKINSGMITIIAGGTFGGNFSIGSGCTMTGVNIPFTGDTITNNGNITTLDLTLAGSTMQVLNGTGNINNLIMNDTSGVSLGGIQTVSNAMTFTKGIMTTGTNKLIIAESATVNTSSASWVNGNLERDFSTTSTLLYPIGDSVIYAPVVLLPSVSFLSSGGLVARTVMGDHPNIALSGIDSTKSINRIWHIQNNGATFDSCMVTFNWAHTDIDAAVSTSNLIVAKYDTPAWRRPTNFSTTSTSLTLSGLTSFSDFQIGEATLFPPLYDTLVTSFDASCNSISNGTAEMSIGGGFPPVAISWFPYGGNAAIASGLSAGSYTCTATDVNGVTAYTSVTINEPTALLATSTAGTIACNGGTTTVIVSATGGTAPYTGEGTFTSTAGNYSYPVTDANGCSPPSATASGTITQPPAIIVTTSGNTSVCDSTLASVGAGASGGVGAFSYMWNSGSTTAGFSLIAQNDTTYTLTVTDATGCTATGIATISVSYSTDIYGHVNYSGGNVTSGSASLYHWVTPYDKYDRVKTVLLDGSGNYHFSNVVSNDYILKIIPDESTYPTLVQTYYGDSFVWDTTSVTGNTATVIHHTCASDDVLGDVTTVELTSPFGGSGALSGYILEDVGFRNTGDPIQGVDVKVGRDPNGGIAAFTTTDAAGFFYFNNLPIGNYRLYVDIPGLYRDSTYHLQITSGNSTYTGLNYGVDSVHVFPYFSTTTINNIISENGIAIYPNPVIGEHLFIDGLQLTIERAKIYNIMGELMNCEQQIANNKKQIDVSGLSKGIYFVQLLISDQSKLVKEQQLITKKIVLK